MVHFTVYSLRGVHMSDAYFIGFTPRKVLLLLVFSSMRIRPIITAAKTYKNIHTVISSNSEHSILCGKNDARCMSLDIGSPVHDEYCQDGLSIG
jgi:hypothetical protein